MLLMALAAWAYSIAVALWRVRTLMLERERQAEWVAGELAALATEGRR
jgi:heme exporter protein C